MGSALLYGVKLCVSPFSVHSVLSVRSVPLYLIRTLWYCTGVPDRTIARVRFPLTREIAVSIDKSNRICFDSTARVAAHKCIDIDRARRANKCFDIDRARVTRANRFDSILHAPRSRNVALTRVSTILIECDNVRIVALLTQLMTPYTRAAPRQQNCLANRCPAKCGGTFARFCVIT
jgi:hypothetical protein